MPMDRSRAESRGGFESILAQLANQEAPLYKAWLRASRGGEIRLRPWAVRTGSSSCAH